MQANPAGLVGMASAMHADLENACYCNGELNPLKDFDRDMTSQYQTSLGLGTSFNKDTFQPTRRRRTGRGREMFGGRQTGGVSRGQLAQYPTSRGGHGLATPIRGRGVCFAHNLGNCHRGSSCHFLHPNQEKPLASKPQFELTPIVHWLQ